MTNIQTLAAHDDMPKLKKREAADMIDRLHGDRGSLSDEDLARLYRFFLPSPSKKPKTDFEWLWRAHGKDDTRPHLNYIWCDGTNAVATDGPRMHVLPCDKPEGFYDWQEARIDWPHIFPSYDRVMPATDASLAVDFDAVPVDSNGQDHAYRIERLDGHTVHLNMRYVQDATGGNPGTRTLHYVKHSPRGPVLFEFDDGRRALVIPVRM